MIHVVEGCQSLFQNTLARVKEGVRDKLSHSGIDYSDVGELDSAFDLPDPFEALDTIYLQDTYFKEHFHYLVCMCYINHPSKGLPTSMGSYLRISTYLMSCTEACAFCYNEAEQFTF